MQPNVLFRVRQVEITQEHHFNQQSRNSCIENVCIITTANYSGISMCKSDTSHRFWSRLREGFVIQCSKSGSLTLHYDCDPINLAQLTFPSTQQESIWLTKSRSKRRPLVEDGTNGSTLSSVCLCLSLSPAASPLCFLSALLENGGRCCPRVQNPPSLFLRHDAVFDSCTPESRDQHYTREIQHAAPMARCSLFLNTYTSARTANPRVWHLIARPSLTLDDLTREKRTRRGWRNVSFL